MRDPLVGATISLPFIVGVVGVSAAHAEGPPTSEEQALTQLMVPWAPLAEESLSAASTLGEVWRTGDSEGRQTWWC